MDNILVKFTADATGLKPGVDGLEQVKLIDAEVAEQAKKSTAAIQARDKAVSDSTKAAKKDVQGLVTAFENLDKSIVGGKTKTVIQDLVKTADGLKNVSDNVGKAGAAIDKSKPSYNGLQNSINQISRELPSAAVSLNTFFLAISNNLPAFSDEIKRLKAANVELAASGQPTQSVLKQVTAGIFSMGTALSVGITLLTLYGGKVIEWVGSLFKGKEALDQFKLSQQNLNTAISSTDFQKAVSLVNELTINIDLAKKGFLDKKEVLNQYNETIGQTTGEVKTLDEAEKALTKNADNYVKMTLYKAAANISLQEAAKKAVEAEKSRIKDLKEFNSTLADTRIAQQGTFNAAEYDRETKRIAEAQEKRKKEEIKISEDAAKVQVDIAKKFQLQAADAAKGFKSFFGGKFDDKKVKDVKTITDVVADLRKELASLDNEQALGRITPTDADIDRVKAYDKAFKGIFDLGGKASTPIVKKLAVELDPIDVRVTEAKFKELIAKLNKPQEEVKIPIADASQNDLIIKNTTEAIQKISDLNDQGYLHDLEKLKSYFDAGYLSREEYGKRIEFLQKQQATTEISNQIALMDAIAANLKAKSDGSKAATDLINGYERKSVELKQQLFANDFKNFEAVEKAKTKTAEDEAKKRQENLQKGLVAANDILKEGAALVFEQETAARQSSLDAQLKALQDQKEKELVVKNITEQQKDDIDKRFKAKENQVKRKAFEDEKQAKKQQAIINGALAITNILATMPKFDFGVASAIAIGAAIASTGLQVARINATKFTGFRKGGYTGDKPVDKEAGIVHGKEFVAHAEATKRYRPVLEAMNRLEFESLLPSLKMPKTLHENISMPVIPPNWQASISTTAGIDYVKLGKEISKHIPAPVQNNLSIDKNGLNHYIVNNGNKITIRNQRYKTT